MSWSYSLGTWGWIAVGSFFVLYVAYAWRIVTVARRLRTNARRLVGKFILRSLYFALLLAALLGPSFGGQPQTLTTSGRDIYVAVDLSQSMDARDVSPTRIERVKFELAHLIRALPSDRLGVLIFSSEAFVQCPLTQDQNALQLFTQTLNTSLVPHTGTILSAALSTALQKLTAPGNATTDNQAKVIIVFTDGEDFGDDTDDVAQKIREAGIHLFVVGVGTEAGSPILINNEIKKTPTGEDVVTKLDGSYLQGIARKARGRYFEITDERNETNALIQSVTAVKGQLRDTRVINTTSNKYYYFLGAALVLMLMDALIVIKVIKL